MGAFHKGGDTTTAFSASSALSGIGDVLRVYNPGTSDVYVRVGKGAQSASASDIVVPGKSPSFIRIGFEDDSVATHGGTALVMRGTLS